MISPTVLCLAYQPSNPTSQSPRNISASCSWLKTGIASSPLARSVARIFNHPGQSLKERLNLTERIVRRTSQGGRDKEEDWFSFRYIFVMVLLLALCIKAIGYMSKSL